MKSPRDTSGSQSPTDNNWLVLAIGNSKLHWAHFVGEMLQESWDTDWGVGSGDWEEKHLPLYLASVVPSQTALWQTYPNVKVITLDQLPLQNLYPSLGIDRALAVLGAGETFGWPILVIDAGTALTLTGADANRQLVGGAILPGLGLQLQSLGERTAALPKIELPDRLPQRWALNTSAAIQSGIIYTILAGIKDFIDNWWCQFPESRIAITGGDRTVLLNYLQSQYPKIAPKLIADPHLIFWGMRSVVIGNW